MKGPLIKTKAGQYTWLQVLALAISAAFFVMGNMIVALILLLAGTAFGIVAAVIRVREAKRTNPEAFVRRRRR